MCNELLRRLSRAEDTTFCGRVYIFLFQSFPLGDRSSVNLRGAYHVENVTLYETSPEGNDSSMDIDGAAEGHSETRGPVDVPGKVTSNAKDCAKPLDLEQLYPLFWSLQESFSQPLKLFEQRYFSKFKDNLGATMKLFTANPVETSNAPVSKPAEDERVNLKRKREGDEQNLAEAFNPKYLTSKDLFQLEVGSESSSPVLTSAAILIMT